MAPNLPFVMDNPTNMRHSLNAGLMLVQRRRRRWFNIKPALGECLIFAGIIQYFHPGNFMLFGCGRIWVDSRLKNCG